MEYVKDAIYVYTSVSLSEEEHVVTTEVKY